ncbi:translation initiation factor IF-2 [Candidatus Uhrbacteria bacterium]|nr:translation initiation factor IF-2 [Candidatus Uhrbacteria bacterium]MBD3284580.1 translation initiation factor IF-2 [Candidatus Uhrbacteria bacterium]
MPGGLSIRSNPSIDGRRVRSKENGVKRIMLRSLLLTLFSLRSCHECLTKTAIFRRLRHIMNVSELARRLRVTPKELLAKLPGLGFSIGHRAIKVDDLLAERIIRKWHENRRRERMRSSLLKTTTEEEKKDPSELKPIQIPAVIIVRDLAGLMNLPVTRVIQELMRNGILAAQNERLDFETAGIIAEELGFKAEPETEVEKEATEQVAAQDRLKEVMESDAGSLQSRPPVIVVMGHVDHGKTKTLDAIRATHVMESEAGGITQHIGAYQAEKKDRKITFIDTPGHEAFTVMRSRGAKVADIAILVVAADDGVQPQTKEAIDIIKAAGLPFIVALNKMDKPEADPDKVLAQLSEYGVQVEDWGGNVPLVKISAKSGMGIDDLLEMILLVADLDPDRIRANPDRLAMGTVIESHVDKGEGPVATILVQSGTLKRNAHLSSGDALYGRVRAMKDWTGKALEEAPPGTPVKILGFKVAPAVGDIIEVPSDPKKLSTKVKSTHQVADAFVAKKQIQTEEEKKETKKQMLQVVLKSDVLGSLEAIMGMLEKVQDERVGVEVIKKGLGNVTDTDVSAAQNASKIVYAFNVNEDPQIAEMSRDVGVEIRKYKIIYELQDDIVKELNKLLKPEVKLLQIGTFDTLAVFRTEQGRMVIGGKVQSGKVVTGEKARVWRGEEPLGDVEIETVQIGKQTMKEAAAGTECGLAIKGKVKVAVGDRLDIYHEEVSEQTFELKR